MIRSYIYNIYIIYTYNIYINSTAPSSIAMLNYQRLVDFAISMLYGFATGLCCLPCSAKSSKASTYPQLHHVYRRMSFPFTGHLGVANLLLIEYSWGCPSFLLLYNLHQFINYEQLSINITVKRHRLPGPVRIIIGVM